jgi:hypothetical protein
MLKLLHFLASLTPSLRRGTLRTADRVAVASQVQALIEYEQAASDSELWARFRRDLAVWANSGVLPPGTVDQLYVASMSLDPRWEMASAERALGRQVLASRLEGLYYALLDGASPAGARTGRRDRGERGPRRP